MMLILDLTHELEGVWIALRALALIFVAWDMVDASRDLRYWWRVSSSAKLRARALALAKWRFGIDVFLLFLAASWIVSLIWAMGRPDFHDATTHVLLMIQNTVVLLLLGLTAYLRVIRGRIVKGGPPQ